LTVALVDPEKFGRTREDIRLALEQNNIESRPVWKPMHLQPVFESCEVRGGGVAEEFFEYGLCLPSGTALTDVQIDRICEIVLASRRS
jgi:dTDP-4-amino-4,6-dideoxygalactose transaminase